MVNFFQRGGAVLLALVMASMVATPAAANYSTLTSAVDWSSAITALMAVAAVIAGVLVIRKGIKFVLASLR
jgi:hypothetical protein